ncbi:hypothetical protein MnTg02_02708 [bacterium MnTg02]|nr:hypothetical protein MnTg02_02708 [bacterium MnTg02]
MFQHRCYALPDQVRDAVVRKFPHARAGHPPYRNMRIFSKLLKREMAANYRRFFASYLRIVCAGRSIAPWPQQKR